VQLIAASALADEAQIRRTLQPKLRGAQIESVLPAPVKGLYEVVVRTENGVEVLYADETAKHLFSGELFDTRSDRNLTEERKRKLSAIRFESLPFDIAVKVKRGSGRRVLAVFSDPYCPACKRFEQVLAQTADITIYYFIFPVIQPDLVEHSRAAWCAPDRTKAWLDLALHGRVPQPRKCADPVDKTLALGQSLRINSTPTLIFANGERVSGGLPPEQLARMLDEAAKSAPHVK
jgi:thiol:disulfide interchange protein DsbC